VSDSFSPPVPAALRGTRAPQTQIRLRDYQSECITAVWSAWTVMQRPAVVLPTGAGKTVIFSGLARQFIESWKPSTNASWGRPYRVVILVHRDELADQTLAKLRAMAPDLVIGKVKAGDNDVHADVMVCSVQTLARKTRMDKLLAAQERYGRVGLVIVDECHHAAAESYNRILDALGCFASRDLTSPQDDGWGDVTRCVGFTATLARGDGIGLGRVWEDVVFSRSVLWMISKGHLVDPHGQEIELANLNLGAVKTAGGDYSAASLGQALEDCEGPRLIARIARQYAPDRRTIIFTPTVTTAEQTVEALREAGFRSHHVSGATPREDTGTGAERVPGRLSIYESFRTGAIDVLVNCMVLTEGADFPMADCAVIARPTKSAPLFIQMVGRVLRPWPGKKDALVLDVAGTGGKISTLIDLDDSLTTPIRDGESLADAYVRQEEEADRVESHTGNTAFLLRHKELDLFTASSHVWQRTPLGVMFIYVGGGFIFLWPRPNGTWNVGGAPERGRGTDRWVVLHKELPLGLATAWAETEAESYASFGVERQASWRRKLASKRMLTLARSMGIRPQIPATQGDVNDAIAVKLATGQFDTVVRQKKKEQASG
jgi:superfamily II DNA or RNA helicase